MDADSLLPLFWCDAAFLVRAALLACQGKQKRFRHEQVGTRSSHGEGPNHEDIYPVGHGRRRSGIDSTDQHAGLAQSMTSPPDPSANACQRACLEGFVNRYLDAMAAHKVDPGVVCAHRSLHREWRCNCRSAMRACGRRRAASAGTNSTCRTSKRSRSPSSAPCWRPRTVPPAARRVRPTSSRSRCGCALSTARSPRWSRSPTDPTDR